MAGMGDVKLAELKAALGTAGFDKPKFAKHLRANVSAKPFGEGKCARHVRLALFEAGRKLGAWPVSAKDWGASMLALGFVPLSETGYVPQQGDVAVIQPPNGEVHGHIQGHDGSAWISDFVQKEFWPGPSYRKDKPRFVVYRY